MFIRIHIPVYFNLIHLDSYKKLTGSRAGTPIATGVQNGGEVWLMVPGKKSGPGTNDYRVFVALCLCVRVPVRA